MCNICEEYVGVSLDSYVEHERWKDNDKRGWDKDQWRHTYIRDRFVQQLMENVLFETETHPIYVAIVRSAIQEYILKRMPDEDIYHHVMNSHIYSPFDNAVGVDTGKDDCCRHEVESCSHMVHHETVLKDKEKSLLKIIDASKKSIKQLESNPMKDNKPIWTLQQITKKIEDDESTIRYYASKLEQIETQKDDLVKMKQRNMRGYDKG